tara:strand:- start:2531 stop:3049 length:519 start_codon:yes stop_codon:yes gene_type:complete
MVKFTSPQEFYDWYNANRAELLAFHSSYASSMGLGSYFYSGDLLPHHQLHPIPPIYSTPKHRYWSQFSDDYPPDKKQEVMEEDEIYIVSNVNGFTLRNSKWWVIYIPNSLYKVNHSISAPFEKEAWWYYRQGETEMNSNATPDLHWISGFIKYDGETPYLGARCLNYPEGGI